MRRSSPRSVVSRLARVRATATGAPRLACANRLSASGRAKLRYLRMYSSARPRLGTPKLPSRTRRTCCGRYDGGGASCRLGPCCGRRKTSGAARCASGHLRHRQWRGRRREADFDGWRTWQRYGRECGRDGRRDRRPQGARQELAKVVERGHGGHLICSPSYSARASEAEQSVVGDCRTAVVNAPSVAFVENKGRRAEQKKGSRLGTAVPPFSASSLVGTQRLSPQTCELPSKTASCSRRARPRKGALRRLQLRLLLFSQYQHYPARLIHCAMSAERCLAARLHCDFCGAPPPSAVSCFRTSLSRFSRRLVVIEQLLRC